MKSCRTARGPPVWFALDESRPLAFFAGNWTRSTSVRKVKEGAITNDPFAFLTTEPNAIVAPGPKPVPPVELSRRASISPIDREQKWDVVPSKTWV